MNKVTRKVFGVSEKGEAINSYTIENSLGNTVTLIEYGASVSSIVIDNIDVALGYNTLVEYKTNTSFMGATAGRVANRIKNARFTLDGKNYFLKKNDGENILHGGKFGFDKRLWHGHAIKNGVMFDRISTDGEEGFPGNVSVTVGYTFDDENCLNIDFLATTDKATPINLTNHTYFNLSGESDGNILDHTLRLNSDSFTSIMADCVPDGNIVRATGTPFDFTSEKEIGKDIDKNNSQLKNGQGYDHNFIVRDFDGTLRDIAVAKSPKTGIVMTFRSTYPGFQFYSGNMQSGETGKSGTKYTARSGFCIEAQLFPSATDYPQFPNTILRPGECYHHIIQYQFTN